MLDIDVAGLASVSEGGIEIERAPEGITFEPLGEHERLGTLVGADDKFTAHNAASWKHGLLVRVPRGVELEQPLYVRIASSVPGGSLFWRLLVIAEEGSRFSLIEEYASVVAGPARRTRTPRSSCSSSRARSSSTSRCRTSPRETWHFATHHARVERDAELDWVAGGFGSKKGKIRIQNDLAGQGATSRVTGCYFADGEQHLDYDTFQEHMAPNTTSDFAFKGALRDTASTVWRGMIRVEPRRAEDERVPGEPQPAALATRRMRTRSRASRSWPTTCAARTRATLGRVDREQLFYLMARGLPRSVAERLIVRGFFQDVLDRIELEPVRETVAAALEARIPQG